MTERMVKIGLASLGFGAVIALSIFVFVIKFDTAAEVAQAPAHQKRYLPITRVAGVKIQVSARVLPDFISSDPYTIFLQKADEYKGVDSSTISVQLFGDIMLDRNVAKAMGTRGLEYIFENSALSSTQRLFGGTDLLVANLEGPFAKKRIVTSKEIAFRFDPALAAALKQRGFHAVSLANNHTYDMGSANVLFTQQTLREAGLGYFGSQYAEGDISVWVASSTLPEPVAFVGFNVAGRELNKINAKKALDSAKKQSRYVIVFMHWGAEYKRLSNTTQRTLARWLVDSGATVVIGAHPHVVQEMEIYHGKPIYYSLGNFIFDQYFSKDTQEGYSVGLILKDGAVKESYIFPFYSKKSQVFPMQANEREKFLEWMKTNSRLGSKIIN